MKTVKIVSICGVFVFLMNILSSCESGSDDYTALSKNLRISATENDGTVQLKWTLAKINNFREYRVYRSKDKNNYYQNSLIYSGTDFFHHTFVDENPNALGTNYYWVEALSGNDFDYTRSYKSNIDSINIGNYPSFSFFPKSVIHNKDEMLIGFIDGRNKFTLYNYESDVVVGTKEVNYNFQYPCFGKYNGLTELYLGENNTNEIGIYDTKSLKKTGSLPLNNQYLYSLASNGDGKIYASCDYGSYIEVINRNMTGAYLINSSYDQQYLKYSESQNALIANEDDSYSYLYVYNADSYGDIGYNNYTSSYLQGYNYSCIKEDPFTGHIYIQPYGKMKPAGVSNTVYSNFGNCQDIAFNSINIFTAPFNSKALYKYDRSGNYVGTIDLPGYPVYILVEDDKLIVFFVEQAISVSQVEYNRVYKGYNQDTPFGIYIVKN
ncbi:hypothetical protein KEM09_12770 [Carboxylicivirga mesophila]|uniref:DUF4374 domain-containing protein n=1 Tax=Carboxylicivirga mesophila TaxID=1166478 RepID=A0ABS5KCM6_9BACT|nr:hypothetical protein [Carboxylicivirga mesophila]MBS2212281.1 hypothetical protein [Carboxylicivirga mesophila]